MTTENRFSNVLRTLARRSGWIALAGWTVTVACWLLTVTGHAPPQTMARLAVVVAAAATLAWVLRLRHPERPLLAVLVVVALAFGYVGLGHEVGKGYYTDEGHYLHHARQVRSGELFTRSFVYPHFSYYRDALALYLADLFPGPAGGLYALYGVRGGDVGEWLLLRMVTAGLGALTMVPVFLLAYRVAGRTAAALAALLQIFSVHYQEGFQVNICDVPSAAFAALSFYFVGRLLEEERTADYLLAGFAAALAAASKYPAGTVAVAVVGIWVVHRIRRRDLRWGLLWSGLLSLGTFLALNPSLFVHTEAAIHGRRGLFFGVRQYATGGWIGVTPPSNTLYYAERLLESYHWPVLLLAAVGFFALGREARRRLLLLLPFPFAFLVLMSSMNMVVLRNLFPAIPALSLFLGVLASGLVDRAARLGPVRRPPGRRPPVVASPLARPRRMAVAVVFLVALALPAAGTFRQTVSLVRPSTRETMVDWVRENVPRGAGILKESYTPNFAADEYPALQKRFAFRLPAERFDDPGYEYLLLAGNAYWRFFRPETDRPDVRAWYERAFATHELLHEEAPGPWRRGPLLRFYRLAGRKALVDRRSSQYSSQGGTIWRRSRTFPAAPSSTRLRCETPPPIPTSSSPAAPPKATRGPGRS